MVKRREPKASGLKNKQPTKEQVEAFGSAAEGKKVPLDEDAKRDFNAMRVPFNQYEYEQLIKGAKLAGRSKLNFMRYAMLMLTKELEKENEK